MTQLEIDAFLEIIKLGSISAASEALFISQPALTRRISTLENELGYRLFDRKKGQRHITLTEKGEAFIEVSKRWLAILREAREINYIDKNEIFNISSVGSVSTYILPSVFHDFAANNAEIRICFHNYHSYESYHYVHSNFVDIALISDDMYHKYVQTIPAFKEPMMLIANNFINYDEHVHPTKLDPEHEIRLPWNPEFDAWHNYWFKPYDIYKIYLDQMTLLEYFLLWKGTWAIVPASVAHNLSKLTYVTISSIEDGPPDRIIYYLKSGCGKENLISEFLNVLNREITAIPNVISYLDK